MAFNIVSRLKTSAHTCFAAFGRVAHFSAFTGFPAYAYTRLDNTWKYQVAGRLIQEHVGAAHLLPEYLECLVGTPVDVARRSHTA